MIIAIESDIRIHGAMNDVMTELTLIIRKVKETLEEELGEDKAREYIAHAGRLAFSSPEELRTEVAKKIAGMGIGLEVDDVLSALKRLEDTGCDPHEFMEKLASDAEDNEEE